MTRLVKDRVVKLRPIKPNVQGLLKVLGGESHHISHLLAVYETKDGTIKTINTRMKDADRLWLTECMSHSTRKELFE